MVWANIGLDFIEALPCVGGKSIILMIVDHFSKYYHFTLLLYPYMAETVAQVFFDDIVHLHRIPRSMVLDLRSDVSRCCGGQEHGGPRQAAGHVRYRLE
jgi:hypothetical protein